MTLGVAATKGWALLSISLSARRFKPSYTKKGFLDCQLEAENAITAIAPILEKLTTLIGEVGISTQNHTKQLERARSTDQRLRVSRAVSFSLDRYSVRGSRIRDRYVEAGDSLSDGLRGWFKWIEESHPSKSVIDPSFVKMMTEFIRVSDESDNHLHNYISTLNHTKGASSVLDAALDRHIQLWESVLNTTIKIRSACSETLRVIGELT